MEHSFLGDSPTRRSSGTKTRACATSLVYVSRVSPSTSLLDHPQHDTSARQRANVLVITQSSRSTRQCPEGAGSRLAVASATQTVMGIRPTPCDNWVQGQYAKCAHAPLHPSQYLTVRAAVRETAWPTYLRRRHRRAEPDSGCTSERRAVALTNRDRRTGVRARNTRDLSRAH